MAVALHSRSVELSILVNTLYRKWPQANIHTHVQNAVPLVWGSLRLALIRSMRFLIPTLDMKGGFKLKWTISDALWYMYMCVAYEVVVESVHFITSTQLKYIHFR